MPADAVPEGAAYLFKRSGATWSQAAALTAGDPADNDSFGGSVSVSEETLAVGASGKNGNRGAAYVFSGVRGNALNQNWTLDAVGNWLGNTLNGTSQSRSHDPANQIGQINADSSDVGYDPAGNMSKLPRVTDNDANGHWIGVYDAWNRLVKLQGDEATPTVYATFAYDGRGRRIGKAVSNSGPWNCTYAYYHDGDSLIEVRNGSDMTIKQQVWGLSYIDELVQQGINSSPSTQSTCDTFYWVCQDANYNVNLLVDSQGYKVERYAYSPYGVRTAYKAADLGDAQLTLAIGSSQAVQVGGVDQPYGICEFGHQGLMLDEESGIVNNRARIYIAYIGLFGQKDPIGTRDGMNLYQYVGSNPIRYVDPRGTDAGAPGAGLDPYSGIPMYDPVWQQDVIRRNAQLETRCGTCGLDVTDLLYRIREEVITKLTSLPDEEYENVMGHTVKVWKRPDEAWDIFAFRQGYPLDGQGCGEGCPNSVTAAGKCWDSGVVNYWLAGAIDRALHDRNKIWKDEEQSLFRNDMEMQTYYFSGNHGGKMTWMDGGYYGVIPSGNYGDSSVGGLLSNCKPCKTKMSRAPWHVGGHDGNITGEGCGK